MTIATPLKKFLDKHDIAYEVITHKATATSSASAEAAHIPGDKMLKSVVIECDEGYMLAVVPSTHRIQLGLLQNIVEKRLGLATESDMEDLFSETEPGAVPPVGEPYGLTVLMDKSVDEIDDVYFEAGDHESLIHMDAKAFQSLMHNAEHAQFSCHV